MAARSYFYTLSRKQKQKCFEINSIEEQEAFQDITFNQHAEIELKNSTFDR